MKLSSNAKVLSWFYSCIFYLFIYFCYSIEIYAQTHLQKKLIHRYQSGRLKELEHSRQKQKRYESNKKEVKMKERTQKREHRVR